MSRRHMNEEMGIDHFMPVFRGDPPAVANPMIQARQWDPSTQRPRVIEHTRHAGERANDVMADRRPAPHAFENTWRTRTATRRSGTGTTRSGHSERAARALGHAEPQA